MTNLHLRWKLVGSCHLARHLEYFSTQRIFKRPSKPIMLSFLIAILLHFPSTIIIQLYNISFVDTNTQINCIWQWITRVQEYFKISVILSRRVLLRWRVLLRRTTGTRVMSTLLCTRVPGYPGYGYTKYELEYAIMSSQAQD